MRIIIILFAYHDPLSWIIFPGEGAQRINRNLQTRLGEWCATEKHPPAPGIEPGTSPTELNRSYTSVEQTDLNSCLQLF